jgi:hypothetical protein
VLFLHCLRDQLTNKTGARNKSYKSLLVKPRNLLWRQVKRDRSALLSLWLHWLRWGIASVTVAGPSNGATGETISTHVKLLFFSATPSGNY